MQKLVLRLPDNSCDYFNQSLKAVTSATDVRSKWRIAALDSCAKRLPQHAQQPMKSIDSTRPTCLACLRDEHMSPSAKSFPNTQ